MSFSEVLGTLKKTVGALPGAKDLVRAVRRRPPPNQFRGVFGTFAEAERIARGAKVGYDHQEFAGFYTERLDRVFASDYPILYWLRDIMAEAPRVFDFGGHVGVAYHGYRRYLTYPDGLRWTVCDVPAVIEAGRKLAVERGTPQLSFTSEFRDADGCDVLLSAGAIQYIEHSFADMLAGLRTLPKHLMINKLPLTRGEALVTLQCTGPAFHPYHMFNRDAFLGSLRALGYEVLDTWENFDTHCHIAGHPERSLDHYTGFYARRSGT